jgi:hypothetical protein
MNVPVHESKVTNAQSGVEPHAYFEGASVDHTEVDNLAGSGLDDRGSSTDRSTEDAAARKASKRLEVLPSSLRQPFGSARAPGYEHGAERTWRE